MADFASFFVTSICWTFFISHLLVEEDYLPRGVFTVSFSPDTRWSALGFFGDNPWLAEIL